MAKFIPTEEGYYWVKSKNSSFDGFFIAYFNAKKLLYPWSIIGSEEIFRLNEFSEILPDRIKEPHESG
jgi:hypothetical protein